MGVKKQLQQIQKIVPAEWLGQLQNIHALLLSQWILHGDSKQIVLNQKSAMVFSPHQDDETFGCGGMIALKREHGVPVTVAFLTDGQGSNPKIKDKIIEIRKQEAVKALEILGVEKSEIHFLEKQDGTLPDLEKEEREKTIEQIIELLIFYKSEEVYVPHRKDCHKDHEATYELVKEAITKAGLEVELLQYPIWMFWRAPIFIMLKLQDIAAAYRVPIGSVQDKKYRAIASYSSQLEGLPSDFVKQFSGSYEIFFKES
jgi:N-acetylglucosamine malate deacetylase 1